MLLQYDGLALLIGDLEMQVFKNLPPNVFFPNTLPKKQKTNQRQEDLW